jgi:hypothetical protein
LGIDLVCVNKAKIYLDISAFENPKLIIFCKNGKNAIAELTLPVSII